MNSLATWSTGDTENGGDPEIEALGDFGGPMPTWPPWSTSTAVDATPEAYAPDIDQRDVAEDGNRTERRLRHWRRRGSRRDAEELGAGPIAAAPGFTGLTDPRPANGSPTRSAGQLQGIEEQILQRSAQRAFGSAISAAVIAALLLGFLRLIGTEDRCAEEHAEALRGLADDDTPRRSPEARPMPVPRPTSPPRPSTRPPSSTSPPARTPAPTPNINASFMDHAETLIYDNDATSR